MTFSEFINQFINGQNLALLGAGLAAILAGLGSARGTSMVGQAGSGLLSEDPSLFGKALILQAIPGTQGVYGLITGFLILLKSGALAGDTSITLQQGAYLFAASLPIAFVGYFSAIQQAKVAVTGINLLAKRPDEVGKAITAAAIVETYAIFALLISLLLVLFFK